MRGVLALVAVLAAGQAAAQTPTAPVVLTTVERTKLPEASLVALARHDQLIARGQEVMDTSMPMPTARGADGVVIKPSAACGMVTPGVTHRMYLRFERGGKLSSYIGDAVDCAPKGYGALRYADGSVWTGEVVNLAAASAPGSPQVMAPAPIGVGVLRGGSHILRGGGAVMRSRITPGAAYSLAAEGEKSSELDFGMTAAAVVFFPSRNPGVFMTRVNREGSGATGVMHTTDGARLETSFFQGTPNDEAAGRKVWPNGNMVTGQMTSFASSMRDIGAGDFFRSTATETIVVRDADHDLPPGQYEVRFALLRNPGDKLKRIIVRPLGDTLRQGGPKPAACRAPTYTPPDWTTFWPECTPTTTVSYANDGSAKLTEAFGGPWKFTWYKASRDLAQTMTLRANQLSPPPMFGPVGPAQLSRGGFLVFRGRFDGLIPTGAGTCEDPASPSLGEEPCFYANGARTDAVYAERVQRRAEEREAKRLAAEEAKALKLAQEAEAAAKQAEIAAANAANAASRPSGVYDYVPPAYEPAPQEMAEEEEDEDLDPAVAAYRANPMASVLADLQQSANRSVYEMQQSQAQVDAVMAAQRRQVEARRQAREAENARIAQANAQAAQNRAAQERAAAQASAAEARRRAAEAQARAEEARARVAALNAARAQASSPSASLGISGPVSGGGSSAGAAAATIAWLEGVVVCPMKSEALMGSLVCHGPFQNAFVDPSKASEVARACGTSSVTPRLIGMIEGSRVWGCNTGINPNRGGTSPHIDQAQRFGLTIPSRRTFRCPATQTTLCRVS